MPQSKPKNTTFSTLSAPDSSPFICAPVSGSCYLVAAELGDWQPTDSPGFRVKPLYEDAARGERTLLMKVDPGAFAPLHAHDGEFEQVYVLEGAFHDQDRTLGAGDYCCRAPGVPHESGSRDGAIVLLVYTRRDPADPAPA